MVMIKVRYEVLPNHAMKAYMGSGEWALHILNLGIR